MRVYFYRACIVAACLFGTAQAQSVDDVLNSGDRSVRLAQASQEKVDKIVDDTRSLLDQYNAVNKEIEGLEVYNALMDRQILDQVEEMGTLAASIDQVTVMERQIMPLMLRMIDGLDQFVQLDVPFLLEERTTRVARLRDLMERSDVSVSEKFRNVFEAYQVENDYGRTIEAYKASLEVAGGTREVDFLRIGRVALLYQSVDGAFTGAWDKDSGEFVALDSGSTRTHVGQGLRMARKQVAPDLLLLPIEAPEEAQ
jgi:hypothetical protein